MPLFGPLAQLVERYTRIVEVGGSNPPRSTMFIPVILGTAREGRRSEAAAGYVVAVTRKAGFETELLDVRETGIRATGEDFPEKERISGILQRADALIIVAPEYNHGYPGELKLFLDSFSSEYAGKPVGICGVSAGGLGGVRAVEQLRLVAIELNMIPSHQAVYFSNAANLFDEQGAVTNPSYDARVRALLEEIRKVAPSGQSGT